MKTRTLKNIPIGILSIVMFISCNSDTQNYDATGYFEAVETIVPAKGNGTILMLNVEEGQQLDGRSGGWSD